MKSFGMGILLLFIAVFPVFSQESSEGSLTTALIVPLESKVDTQTYSAATAELSGDLFSDSIYSFLSIIPLIDTKSMDALPEGEAVSNVAASENVDLVIYGEFEFSGSASSPQMDIVINVFDAESGEIIYSGSYSVNPSSFDVFDIIDDLNLDVVGSALGVDAKIGIVTFRGFDINEIYDVYEGAGTFVTSLTNTTDNFELKILADTAYTFNIVRQRDEVTVDSFSINLSEWARTNLTYSATAALYISELKNKYVKDGYTLTLDGETLSLPYTNSSLSVTSDHQIEILDVSNTVVSSETLTMVDGEEVLYEPQIQKVRTESDLGGLTVFAGQSSEIGLGYVLYPFSGGLQNSFIELSLSGNPVTGFTTGAPGYTTAFLNFGYTFTLSDSLNASLMVDQSFTYFIGDENLGFSGITGLSAEIAWKGIFLRAGAGYDHEAQLIWPLASLGYKF